MQPIDLSFTTTKDKGVNENTDLVLSFQIGEKDFIDWKHIKFSAHHAQIAKLTLPGMIIASAAQKDGSVVTPQIFVEIAPGQKSTLTTDENGFVQWSDPESQPSSALIVLVNKTTHTQAVSIGIREQGDQFSPIYGPVLTLPSNMNAEYAVQALRMCVFGYRYPRDPNSPEHDPKDMLGEYTLSKFPSPIAFQLFDDPSHGGQTVLVVEPTSKGHEGKANVAAEVIKE